MKLDEKIKSKLMIYDCYETIEAEKYVGKNGYFTNNFSDFADLIKTKYGTLTQVATNNYSEKPYYDDNNIYAYFLPEEYVRQEKTFRPLSLQEFHNRFNLGDFVKFRFKNSKNHIYKAMFNGVKFTSETESCVDDCVSLGSLLYSLKYLFENNEYFDSSSNEWLPFGVEE